ncbi:hypothetical protein [Rhodoglobus aureus]|uniref:Restriction endonuclease subunit S n=1 Tax=Rhodoglobus aureus TaxID=191497 RepID=A0ABN1VKR7_9MICO
MTKLKPYNEYKTSGIEWLAEIPADWAVRPFRHAFRESSEVNGDSPVGKMLSISGYRGVEIKKYDDENQRRTEAEVATYRVVRPGQLAVNTMWLNYGGLGVSELTGHVSPAYRTYWIDESFERRYLHHLMRSATYIDAYTSRLTGIRPNSLQMSRDNLMVFPILKPPRAIQRSIADFLDRETAEIDAFIADQEELIGLLAERRAATISHAVTKGLDPTVPMKDSGVEWIGEIPTHWRLPRLAYVARCSSGLGMDASQLRADQSEAAPFAVYGGNGVIGFGALHNMAAGGIAIGRVGALCGNAHVICEESWVTDNALRLVLDTSKVDQAYLHDVLVARRLNELADKTAQPLITGGAVLAQQVPEPPLGEQRAIASYLRRETAEYDAAIADAKEAIALSRERRAALISAAVTGKIDVREHGAVA